MPIPSRRTAFLLSVLLPLLLSRAARAQALRWEVEEALRGYPGVAGVSVKNLATGEAFSLRGDEAFPTASLVKVPILVTLLDQVARGRIGLGERLSLTTADRVGGSGVLQYLDAGLLPTVKDAAWLMIALSDNTATNLVLDEVGVIPVWEKMDSLGLTRTRVYRKAFSPNTASPRPDSAAKYGLGVTTPDEMLRLFELLHRGRAVSPAMDSLALAMLRTNQNTEKLVRWIPESVEVAHKSGEVDRSRNDCGILYSPAAPIAVCVMTRENRDTGYRVDNPAHLLAGRIARIVFQHYNPGVPLPPLPPQQ